MMRMLFEKASSLLVDSLSRWVVERKVRVPRKLEWHLAHALAKQIHQRARVDYGPEIPDLPLPPRGPEKYEVPFMDLKFLREYPWAEHLRLRPTIVGVPEALVFMPTYAPKGKVQPGSRGPGAIATYVNILHRGWTRAYESPWTYLDAIDSIFHNLSTDVHLVVADFRSSDEIRQVLLEHQRSINAPNYELWFTETPESPWVAMNCVLLKKFSTGDYTYFIHTTSDVLWTQRGWLTECILEMNRDFDCLITYPTVSKVAANAAYQRADLPVDKDPFTVSLANAYIRVFHRDFFEPFDYRYPDIFRNCYTESFIPMMLNAIGKIQKIVPRANCAHCEGLDIWAASDGTTYMAGEEHKVFVDIMGRAKMMLSRFPPQAEQLAFLRQALYRDAGYYDTLYIERYRCGEKLDSDPRRDVSARRRVSTP